MLSNSIKLIPAGFVMHTAQEVQFMKLFTQLSWLSYLYIESSVNTYFVMVAYLFSIRLFSISESSCWVHLFQDMKSVQPQPYDKVTFLQAIKETCRDIKLHLYHSWIQHSYCSFLKSTTWENILFDVNEILWLNWNERLNEYANV